MTQRPFLSQANARTQDRTIADAVSEPLMTSRSDPEYCRRQAETCHEMAEKATDARDREGWLRLAQDWIELAEQGGQVGKKSPSPGRSKVGKNLLARRGLSARPTQMR